MSAAFVLAGAVVCAFGASVAAEDEAYVPERAVSGLQGWVDCFERAELAGYLFCGGISDMGEAAGRNEELDEAYEFGKALA